MFSSLSGTAKDVSMLIDYLPCYLFPNDDREITEWGVVGVSLGGHATWLCLTSGFSLSLDTLMGDERINWGCSIIGCPSYINLMYQRLAKSNLPANPPHFPSSFIKILSREDPGYKFTDGKSIPETLKSKHILVLSGQDDPLVPWDASKEFIEELQKLSNTTRVNVYPRIGHKYTLEMLADLKEWVLQFL